MFLFEKVGQQQTGSKNNNRRATRRARRFTNEFALADVPIARHSGAPESSSPRDNKFQAIEGRQIAAQGQEPKGRSFDRPGKESEGGKALEEGQKEGKGAKIQGYHRRRTSVLREDNYRWGGRHEKYEQQESIAPRSSRPIRRKNARGKSPKTQNAPKTKKNHNFQHFSLQPQNYKPILSL